MAEEINFYLTNREYGWLSNLWKCDQMVAGVRYHSNEHYYQSQKTTNFQISLWVLNAPKPYFALKAGKAIKKGKGLRPDWDDIKVSVMLLGLRAKFRNPDLRENLLATGDATIHEDTSHSFWGKKGKDMLGKLLMQVREEIRQGIQ